MKKGYLYLLFLLPLWLFSGRTAAQMQGAEISEAKMVYKGTFVVNGDMNTYYPVVFKNGEQNKVNKLVIFRHYGAAGPNALHPTHKGALTLEIDVNYGGWGGSTYDWRIMDLRETYHNTFAGAAHGMHNMGFIVWLRGGGFVYAYESDKPANLQVAYSTSEIIFNSPYPDRPDYTVYAPSPKTTRDIASIQSHTNGFFVRTSNGIGYKGGAVAVGELAVPAGYKFAVDGKAVMEELTIKLSEQWPDYVFAPGYNLAPLSEMEQFIQENGHLPGVPSAAAMDSTGMDLGKMVPILLKKIEELTLHVIELEKRVEIKIE